MEKTYEIVDASVNHPEHGLIKKENIIYYDENGVEENRELYSKDEQVLASIKEGYVLKEN